MKLLIKIFIGFSLVYHSTIFSQTIHFTFTSNTGNNATVVILTAANPNINGVLLSASDEIGAFTPAGLCVGATAWNNSNTAITVWGDNDQTVEVDGIQSGQLISFKIWDQSENIEYDSVNVTYNNNSPFISTGLYEVNGFYNLTSLSAAPPTQPTITVSATSLPDFGNVLVNTSSASKSYTVSGINLTEKIVLTAPSGFELSTNDSTFSSSVIFSQSGGTVSSTPVYTRFSPTSVMTYTGNISHTSTGAASKNVTISGKGIDSPTLNLSPPNQPVTYTAGSTTFSVTSNISWTVNYEAAWLTVSPISGSGNRTLTVSYDENTTNSQRVGEINVSGGGISRLVTVTQNPRTIQTPLIIIQPQNQTVTEGQTATFNITATCPDSIGYQWWREPFVSEAESKIVNIPGKIEGATNNQLRILNAASEEDGTQYLCEVYNTLDHQNAWVNSAIVALEVNYLRVDTNSTNVDYKSGSLTFTVTSNTSWNVSANVSWLTISPVSGTNNATLTVNYEENTIPSGRAGTVTIIGSGISRTIIVTQNAAPFTLTVSPSNRPVSALAGSTTFTITSNTSWILSDDADWITIFPADGGGNETLTASYTENITTSQRVGTITIDGGGITKTVTVTQDAPTQTEITINPSNHDVVYTAGIASFSITSNTSWSVNDDADWITVSPTTGSNSDTLRATYSENTTTVQRVGTITVTGNGITRTATISQGSSPFILIVTPPDRAVPYTTGSTNFSILSNASWSVIDDAEWVIISPTTGNYNGAVTASYIENTTTNQRVGTVTVIGVGLTKLVTVTQAAAPSILTINPTDRYVSYTAGSTTFNITSNTSWIVGDDADWLSVLPTSGSDNETLTASYEENTTTGERIGTITVTGGGIINSVKVNQEGSTGIEELKFINSVPSTYMLSDNYPNPFNPSTTIEFGIPEESTTQLKVYDIMGNEITTLLEHETLHAGKYRYKLNAESLSSGIYIYILLSESHVSKESFRSLKKMILLK